MACSSPVGPQTLAQKLVAKASGRGSVTPGEIVTCKVDLAMMHDSGGPRRVKPMLERLGAKVWDPKKIVVVTDHYVPATDDESRKIVRIAREWVREAGVDAFYDEQGICHVVVPERGHLRPGMFAVGGDSHSPTGGAFAAYMFGVGATEMLGVLVTGEIWLKVPHTIAMEFSGRFAPGVCAKDVMLFLIGRFGLDGGQYQAVEYRGEAIRALPMQERMTLCNMAAELGAQTGLIASDSTTAEYLKVKNVEIWESDPGAAWLAQHRFKAQDLAPQVAAPHSPANTRDAASFKDVALNMAYLGACTGAKLEDLRMAASVLKNRKARVKLVVAPASVRDREAAEKEGVLKILADAGAEFIASSCGICAGYGAVLPDDCVAISSTARNFKGRMGSPKSQVYLGSPYTVAASAVAGRIADPRELLA